MNVRTNQWMNGNFNIINNTYVSSMVNPYFLVLLDSVRFRLLACFVCSDQHNNNKFANNGEFEQAFVDCWVPYAYCQLLCVHAYQGAQVSAQEGIGPNYWARLTWGCIAKVSFGSVQKEYVPIKLNKQSLRYIEDDRMEMESECVVESRDCLLFVDIWILQQTIMVIMDHGVQGKHQGPCHFSPVVSPWSTTATATAAAVDPGTSENVGEFTWEFVSIRFRSPFQSQQTRKKRKNIFIIIILSTKNITKNEGNNKQNSNHGKKDCS